MTTLDERRVDTGKGRLRRQTEPGQPEGNEHWRGLSDECSGTYTKRIDSYGAYLCFLAVLRRAVDDLKPHNPPDIQAEAAVWLRTEGRRWITRLRISRTCEDEHVQRLVYGGITNRQESLWEDRT